MAEHDRLVGKCIRAVVMYRTRMLAGVTSTAATRRVGQPGLGAVVETCGSPRPGLLLGSTWRFSPALVRDSGKFLARSR